MYEAADAAAFLTAAGLDAAKLAPQIEGRFMSAFVRATKPARAHGRLADDVSPAAPPAQARSCCGPECCSAA